MFDVHPRKLTNSSPKRDHFSREYIFQPLIFRGHVSFQGSITKKAPRKKDVYLVKLARDRFTRPMGPPKGSVLEGKSPYFREI